MSTTAALKENKMGTMPVGRLLFSMALPLAISMLVQAFYNVVDSYYVPRISESAVTALGLAFPIQNLMISFATGIGVGMNALLSKSLGGSPRRRFLPSEWPVPPAPRYRHGGSAPHRKYPTADRRTPTRR